MKLQQKQKAVVVLSGGQDSTYCAAWAKLRYREVHALTFDYGQRHAREVQAAQDVARLLELPHEVVKVGPILKGTSPLVNSAEQLEQYATPQLMAEVIGDRVEKTFVPMRNALFLTLAANRAACLGGADVVTGVCQDDNANYPDCTRDFINGFEVMGFRALGEECVVLLEAPLLDKTKAEQIIEMRNMEALALYAFTHTSYAGDYPPLDRNHATVLREEAFAKAGLPDPLIVRAHMEGLMPLPDAPNYRDAAGAIADLEWRILRFKEHLDYLATPEVTA
jgi:7-cyano-7-deazaguanine synthase